MYTFYILVTQQIISSLPTTMLRRSLVANAARIVEPVFASAPSTRPFVRISHLHE
jgi:hypothetical protein